MSALAGPDAPSRLLALPWTRQHAELVAVAGGYDVPWERSALRAARTDGTTLLSVRAGSGELLIGPLWSPAGESGCAGCAWIRDADRRAPEQVTHSAHSAAGTPAPEPVLPGPVPADSAARARPAADLLTARLAAELLGAGQLTLEPGDLVSISADGVVRRHRVRRSTRCDVCGPGPGLRSGRSDDPPEPLRLQPRPSTADVPDRAGKPFDLDPATMRTTLADARFGPMLGLRRDGFTGMAMTEIRLLGARFPGHGRATTYRRAELVGGLEALERIGGYPLTAPIVAGASARRLGERAIDVTRLGHYTAAQLASPLSRLRPFDADTPMDWVWGRELTTGRPLLVPAEIGFYQYSYPVVPDPEAGPGNRRTHYLEESSSGSALGSSYEEATLHSLLELAERDAFLLCWHRATPLPRIAPDQVTDPECRLLTARIEDKGYEVHLLVATRDLGVPVVWSMAVRRDGRMPVNLSAAGSGADPESAARAALWELSQMVDHGVNWDVEEVRPIVEDPWQVDELVHHNQRYSYPELSDRAGAVLGGETVGLVEAFPGWPGVFTAAAGGDLTAGLRFVAGLFRQAGLDQIVVVDQSTAEHVALGVRAVKAVVPGILPMCFGQAQQRLSGLPRLVAALTDARGRPPRAEDFPFDPHPFP